VRATDESINIEMVAATKDLRLLENIFISFKVSPRFGKRAPPVITVLKATRFESLLRGRLKRTVG
jgi:hypothetical protein